MDSQYYISKDILQKKVFANNSKASKNSTQTGGENVPTKYLDRMCFWQQNRRRKCVTQWGNYGLNILCVNARVFALVINHGWGNKPAKLKTCVIA